MHCRPAAVGCKIELGFSKPPPAAAVAPIRPPVLHPASSKLQTPPATRSPPPTRARQRLDPHAAGGGGERAHAREWRQGCLRLPLRPLATALEPPLLLPLSAATNLALPPALPPLCSCSPSWCDTSIDRKGVLGGLLCSQLLQHAALVLAGALSPERPLTLLACCSVTQKLRQPGITFRAAVLAGQGERMPAAGMAALPSARVTDDCRWCHAGGGCSSMCSSMLPACHG